MTVYALRDKRTGLYSTGGYNPEWKIMGKTWSQKGHLRNHLYIQLSQLNPKTFSLTVPKEIKMLTLDEIMNKYFPDLEIVELNILPRNVASTSI